MKFLHFIIIALVVSSCTSTEENADYISDNPLLTGLNEMIDYADVSADDLQSYSEIALQNTLSDIKKIKNQSELTFENVFGAYDDIHNNIVKTSNNCFMLYWVSPDSLTRIKGFEGYQLMDSLSTAVTTDKELFNQMVRLQASDTYDDLQGSKKKLVDDLINDFKHLGVDLDNDRLTEFRNLKQRISRLSSEYSNNMNASDEVLILDEAGAEGLSEDFKSTYVNDENKYVIPIINATRTPVLGNATSEETRKAYYMLFYNRAADANLRILDSLIADRYELAEIMGYPSFAAYSLSQKMAKNPESVWDFTYNLTNLAKVKASADLEKLRKLKAETVGEADAKLYPWDILYYKNEILKKEYDVDKEALRAYFPMQESLAGMFEIYQNLLGLEFRKVENPSVWHEDVDMYEVYEGDSLKGRFYLDLYPRANKESWFYGVGITPGKLTENGYEVPVSMLLGNFTKGTEQLPSLLSLDELNILFHEFGHIVNGMSYDGAFALQSESENDFVESMSQIFENWVWDYDILKTFAKHYQTGEVLPKEVFENLLAGKNITSGYDAVGSLRYCLYDMNLYDKYNPEDPIDTDELWKSIDDELGLIPLYAEGTHPQASWIHINTHPVYYYGYLWSEVYAQDMFTEFEKNGLQDSVTGIKYRKVVLSNGTQRDIEGSVEEFLGRPANNKAYIKSLGLE